MYGNNYMFSLKGSLSTAMEREPIPFLVKNFNKKRNDRYRYYIYVIYGIIKQERNR